MTIALLYLFFWMKLNQNTSFQLWISIFHKKLKHLILKYLRQLNPLLRPFHKSHMKNLWLVWHLQLLLILKVYLLIFKSIHLINSVTKRPMRKPKNYEIVNEIKYNKYHLKYNLITFFYIDNIILRTFAE